MPREHDIDELEARMLMPPMGDLTKDTVLFHRWIVHFPKTKPNHCTKVYGGKKGFTELAALKFVLAQAWTWFEETKDGYACPFPLDL